MSALALLALATWTGPALASAGAETRCDQAVYDLEMPEAAPPRLSVDVVDASEAETAEELAPPLAVEQTDTIEEAASNAVTDDARNSAADLPGVSDDDLIRFKRQMYRTDI